jgi:hypothetical protein
MDEIIRTVMLVLGRNKPVLPVPLELARLAGTLLELVPGQLLSSDALDFVTQSAQAALESLERLFPDLPTMDLEAALRSYL